MHDHLECTADLPGCGSRLLQVLWRYWRHHHWECPTDLWTITDLLKVLKVWSFGVSYWSLNYYRPSECTESLIIWSVLLIFELLQTFWRYWKFDQLECPADLWTITDLLNVLKVWSFGVSYWSLNYYRPSKGTESVISWSVLLFIKLLQTF